MRQGQFHHSPCAIEESLNNCYSPRVREELDLIPANFTVSDPGIPGNPIVFASAGFLKMCGYSREEIVGGNGRILQGPGTCKSSLILIGEAVREEKEVEVRILNYRKDGTPFWMFFRMCPIFSEDDGRVIHFVGVQIPIFPSCDTAIRHCRRTFSIETDQQYHPSDSERKQSFHDISSIVNVLTRFSKFTGKPVSDKRSSKSLISYLPSSVHYSLGRINQSFVLTDPHLPDNPIVYANDAFLRLTGYEKRDVLGRNCRFLSGEDTDPAVQREIGESIASVRPCTVRILNYRKDCRCFWNVLHVSPVRNATGKVAYFVGVQTEEGGKGDHLSVVGAVKVAIRSIGMFAGPSN